MTTQDLPVTPAGGLPERALTTLRWMFGGRIRRGWDVHERGQGRIPPTGPVIFASNHIGWLDGPLMIALSPRPAHALVKSESFVGREGMLLRLVGQISIRREQTDAKALRRAIRALRAGQCIVVYPEGRRGDGELRDLKPGLAYLAMVTGAPIVPVAIFGTRLAGEHSEWRPPKGSRVEMHYGAPFSIDQQDWPRTTDAVAAASRVIARRLRDHLADARTRTKVPLPGLLPAGDIHA